MKKFWEKIDLVIVYDTNGTATIGRIVDVNATTITIKDIQGFRHWLFHDSISKIQELERKD
jgi:hypothetical protein